MRALTFAFLLACPGAASGQQAVTVAPGHHLLELSSITERTDSAVIEWHTAGATREGPLQVQRQSFMEYRGVPAIRLITTVGRPGATPMLVDTSYFRQADLAPLHHHSVGPGRDLLLDYHGQSAKGYRQEGDSSSQPIAVELAEAVFDPSAVELVFRAIPWQAGLKVVIPTLDHATLSTGSVTASPIGTEMVRRGDQYLRAWILRLDYGTHGAIMWLADDGGAYVLVPATGERGDLHMSYGGVTVPSLMTESEEMVVEPGSGAAAGSRLVPYHVERRVVFPRGDDSVTIDINDRLTRGRYQGQDSWIRIQRISTMRGVRVDSAVFATESMEPRYHSGYLGNHSMQLHFQGSLVTGRYTPQDSSGFRTIDQSLTRKPFDSNAMELVAASLPLAEGYRARVPLYWYERGGLTWVQVSVLGVAELTTVRGRERAWEVELDLLNAPRKVWISTTDRMVVAGRTEMADGRVIENRLTAIGGK